MVPETPLAGGSVLIVQATVALPLPAATCAGLKLQIARFGSPEQAKLTLLGNDPVVGLRFRVKLAVCPAVTEVLAGVAVIAKSKVAVDDVVNETGTECLVVAESLPTPMMLKL